MQKQVHSFDVFDTVITRVTGSPEVVFLFLGKRLIDLTLIDCSPEAFARLRAEAERRARRNVGPGMALVDVYSELRSSLGITAAQVDKLSFQEMILQHELIRPVPCLRVPLQALRDEGCDIIFVSDMYLPARFIEQQLKDLDVWREGDRCYMSCEYGKTKSSDELFPEILRCENISPSQIVHSGNDLRADVTAANKAGIEAQLFPQGNLNRYEKILESHVWSTEGFSSLLAGASRLTRLTLPVASAHEEAIRDVAAGVAAPILVSYVLWLLRRAQELNLKRLYFLSRDGQILLEIARQLADKLSFSCELRYLYGSRLALNRATIEHFDEHWIWSPLSKFCSLEYFFDRLGILQEEVIDSLCDLGFTASDWHRSLNPEEVQRLRSALDKAPVKELIFEKTACRRQLLDIYLSQEGLLDSDKKGVVDLGWAGSMYSALSRLVNAQGGSPLAGFYFAKNRSPGIDPECERLEAYFFDERVNQGFLDNTIKDTLELFCSADHGTALGYEEGSKGVHPVLEEDANQSVIDWGLPVLRKTVDCFIENLLLDPSLTNIYADTRGCTAAVFEAFWLDPSASEAAAWGDLPWENHLPHSGGKPLAWAERYEWKHVLDFLRHGKYPRHHSHSWVRSSTVRSLPSIQKALKYTASFKRRGLKSNLKALLKSRIGL